MTLTSVVQAEFALLRELASAIWRQHYTEIVSTAQVEHMLAGRFSEEALREYVSGAERWLKVLRVSGEAVGYCASERGAMHGAHDPTVMKLGQLYVLESHRGMGLGRFMIRHVEDRARAVGSRVLWLQVNKQNTGSIGFYRSLGFVVVREAVFDIGGGFVMDDYVMAKDL